jgi:predicted DNA-binding transcriptional regulator AlpA
MTMKEDKVSSELLDVKETMNACDCSERHIWNLLKMGLFLKPIRLGRSVKWRRSELLAWIGAGCPSQADWETMRKEFVE